MGPEKKHPLFLSVNHELGHIKLADRARIDNMTITTSVKRNFVKSEKMKREREREGRVSEIKVDKTILKSNTFERLRT